jgi:hypothetical protein
MTKITTLQPLDPLKVFLEFDTGYQVYVAQCLQTGHLVTADDPETAKEMITELLEDEVSLAVKSNDISALLSHPAPMELWFKWDLASKVPNGIEENPRKIRVYGGMPQELRLLVGQDYRSVEVETEVRIATGKTANAAA